MSLVQSLGLPGSYSLGNKKAMAGAGGGSGFENHKGKSPHILNPKSSLVLKKNPEHHSCLPKLS